MFASAIFLEGFVLIFSFIVQLLLLSDPYSGIVMPCSGQSGDKDDLPVECIYF